MSIPLFEIEPFNGWLGYYDPELDARSPFTVDPDTGERYLYTFEANPHWDSIGSESLLVKILFVHYEEGYALIELLGEWTDLFENDWRLLCENCLDWLVHQGITQFILLCDNVFQAYFDSNDYYEAFAENNPDGWVCLFRARPEVRAEFERFGLSGYFYWNENFNELRWRKHKPWELHALVQASFDRLLPGTGTAQLSS